MCNFINNILNLIKMRNEKLDEIKSYLIIYYINVYIII